MQNYLPHAKALGNYISYVDVYVFVRHTVIFLNVFT